MADEVAKLREEVKALTKVVSKLNGTKKLLGKDSRCI
jgi:hypothetical protein